jgi:Rrf2 family cysteine metabolism transcriptional repressor
MKFSIRVQYGLQAVLELALKYGSGSVQIKDIAKNQKVPIRYLEQLLLNLKRKGVVASVRGKHGGYTIAKHPSDISLLDIVETFEGPIEFANKKMKRTPILLEAFEKVQENLNKDLSSITLEDLVLRLRQKERAFIYNI